MIKYIKIDKNSRKPKYLQIVDSIINNISWGNFGIDSKMPSINSLSEEFYLSRDTVEKAYKILKDRKILVAVRGKGYYISKTTLVTKTNVLFLVNKLSSYKMKVYNSFNERIGVNTVTDLQIYHCEESLFLNLLEKYNSSYDYIVLMLHFKADDFRHITASQKVIKAINKIPSQKLVLLDNDNVRLDQNIIEVYQDFENDIYNALTEGLEKIKNYRKIVLVYPEKSVYPYPKRIVNGFKKFCVNNNLDYEVIDFVFDEILIKKGDLFITIGEDDLVNLIRKIREDEFELGKEIGVLSYNDTQLKDLLGISVISTDMKSMGVTAARMILEGKKGKVKNPFKFIDRKSI